MPITAKLVIPGWKQCYIWYPSLTHAAAATTSGNYITLATIGFSPTQILVRVRKVVDVFAGWITPDQTIVPAAGTGVLIEGSTAPFNDKVSIPLIFNCGASANYRFSLYNLGGASGVAGTTDLSATTYDVEVEFWG